MERINYLSGNDDSEKFEKNKTKAPSKKYK